MSEPAVRLIPWDKSAGDSGREALASIEAAIDALSEALTFEEEDRLPLKERIDAWQGSVNHLNWALGQVNEGLGALRRRIAADAKEKGWEPCRKCFRYFDPKTMKAVPFAYGTKGDTSVRYFCASCGDANP